ncbi:MAG TPA: amidohydrolase family protein, partial [Chloroflexota bacterium]|nr:amidohydrolase family protein [Chloroflexota bacterium]
MTTLLVRNARLLITMNDAGERITNGALFVRGNVIEWVGDTAVLPPHYHTADHMIDATDQVVLPGLVNTHHHLYQTLTRALAPNSGLFAWLKTLYPIWARMDGEAIYISALVGMAELMLSGCTTASDHLYLFPNGAKLDDEIRAAQEAPLAKDEVQIGGERRAWATRLFAVLPAFLRHVIVWRRLARDPFLAKKMM